MLHNQTDFTTAPGLSPTSNTAAVVFLRRRGVHLGGAAFSRMVLGVGGSGVRSSPGPPLFFFRPCFGSQRAGALWSFQPGPLFFLRRINT